MNINEENKELINKFIATAGITSDDIELQGRVVDSECDELHDAVSNNDVVEVIDGFADVIFASEALRIIRASMFGNNKGIKLVEEFALANINLFFKKPKYKKPNNDDLNEMLHEVCVSNMSKFDITQLQASWTKRKYKDAGIKTSRMQIGSYFVTRSAEKNNDDYPFGKILKSAVNYKAPYFGEIIKRLTEEL